MHTSLSHLHNYEMKHKLHTVLSSESLSFEATPCLNTMRIEPVWCGVQQDFFFGGAIVVVLFCTEYYNWGGCSCMVAAGCGYCALLGLVLISHHYLCELLSEQYLSIRKSGGGMYYLLFREPGIKKGTKEIPGDLKEITCRQEEKMLSNWLSAYIIYMGMNF